jgi:MFS transporter, FSR family, fosmidomycin resistance protein
MQPSAANNERNVVLLTGVGHFGTHFFELMYPTLAVTLAQETGAPLERVFGWSFLGYLLFGLGALPFGMLADRIGARLLIIAGIFGMGVFAIAASESGHGTALAICLGGMGLSASIYHPVGMSLISRTVARRGRAMALNGIFGNVAIALTPIVTATLCESVGWRGAYAFTGYAACALAVACAFLAVDESRAIETPTLPAARAQDRAPSRSLNLFAVLLVAAALGGISYRGNTVIQPAYFDQRVSMLDFGATTSLVYLIGIGGQYLGGMLADRHDLRWLYFAFHAISLPALIGMAALSDLPLVVLAMIFVFFSLGMQPIENSLVAHVTPVRWRSTAYGLKFVLTFGVGSVAVWLVDWAKTQRDLSFAILCLAAVVALLLAVIAIFLSMSWGREFRNREVEETAAPLAAV